MIENKPWNPYNRRHTALTEKATILGDFNLRQHAGWTKDSKMLDVYTHELGDESMEGLLLAYGIDTDNKQERNRQQALVEARTCPHCSEPNKQDAKFCIACQMVLTFDEYKAATESLEKQQAEMKEMKERLDSFERIEEDRKEHEAELYESIEGMISRMDNLIIKIYEVNPTTPLLPTKELQDTFASIVGGGGGGAGATSRAMKSASD